MQRKLYINTKESFAIIVNVAVGGFFSLHALVVITPACISKHPLLNMKTSISKNCFFHWLKTQGGKWTK